jgi:hypothetical protein
MKHSPHSHRTIHIVPTPDAHVQTGLRAVAAARVVRLTSECAFHAIPCDRATVGVAVACTRPWPGVQWA